MMELKKIQELGNIPKNCGFDPYNAWRWQCRSCGSQGTIFENQITPKELKSLKKNWRKHRTRNCNGCGSSWTKVIYKLDAREAFHKNDIRFRGVGIDKRACGIT